MKNFILFLAWLADVSVGVMTILIILGIWAAPMWFIIALSIYLLISCGFTFTLYRAAIIIMIVLIITGIWLAPLWVSIIISILICIGFGASLNSVFNK